MKRVILSFPAVSPAVSWVFLALFLPPFLPLFLGFFSRRFSRCSPAFLPLFPRRFSRISVAFDILGVFGLKFRLWVVVFRLVKKLENDDSHYKYLNSLFKYLQVDTEDCEKVS